MLRLAIILLAPTFLSSASAQDMVAPAALRAGDPTAPVNTGTIGRMIAAAAPGSTITVPAGDYHEHIRIDKPLTVIGEGRPVINGGGRGDIIEIAAPDVTFRGFTVHNTGIDLDKENAAIRVLAPRATIEDNHLSDILFGIDLRDAPGSIIRSNLVGGKHLDIARRGDGVRLWRSDDTLVEGNTIHDGRDAVLWYSTGVTVRGNTSLRCRYGFHLMYSDGVVLEDNYLAHNSVGVYIMYSKQVTVRRNRLHKNRGPSGYGLGLKETDRFTIEQNQIIGNRVGIYLDGSPFTSARPGDVNRNVVAYNDVGITFLPAVRGNQFTRNNFIDNVEQISVSGRGELKGNAFWKDETGNFWTDYVGYDQNADGVGDFVHESQTLFENLMDREPKLRILLFSPAQQAVEFVGRALPSVRPEPKFTDEVPLMRPVDIGFRFEQPHTFGRRASLIVLSAVLLGIGGSLLTIGRQPAPRKVGSP
jgi:nitrous oxidase accessory protein